MTQEEKAKAYDEALERARKMLNMILDNELLGFPDQIREIFPQLRESESEDERIRKELIEFIQWSVDRRFMREDFHQAKRPSEWIAWLERQKEQKHTLKFKVGDKVHMEGDDSVILTITEIKEDRYLTDCGPILFGAEDIWQIVEQKSWEWSEEDENMAYFVNQFLEYHENADPTAKSCKKWFNNRLKSLRPQYHGDVTMTEAYKMGLEAGKASSWKPSEKQTNNVIVELTQIELGDIINGLYYLKEKYYEDCKEHNGTATVGLSDEFKFYFKRFNEALDLYTRLHELEKEKYGTTTDGYYYE